MTEQPSDYRITLQPLPDRIPGIARLRRFLKMALRGYGLRCVRNEEVPAPPADHATDAVLSQTKGIPAGEGGSC
jgi:hypothetical protein